MAPNIPKRHKAAMFKEKGGPLVVEEIDTKSPEAGEVLVKVHAVGVCHSDAMIQGQIMGNPYPFIPGHEIIGDIVQVGPGEKHWKVDDRVGGGWHGGHDGTCKCCRKAFNQACDNKAINGVTRNGGYAEYCLLRSEAVVNIPKEVDPAASAPLLCAGVTVFNSMRRMNISVGELVAVHGLGGLGHLAIQYARKMGFRVAALSSSASKEKFARDLGATEYIDGSKEKHVEALQKMGGAAMIVSSAPNPDIVGELVYGLAPQGKLLILAPTQGIKIDSTPLVLGGSSIHGWPSGNAQDSEEAVKFAQLQGINCLIEKFPLDKAHEAFEHMMSGKARFRSVIVMD